MFDRSIEKPIMAKINKGKIIIVTGPRQVGKTTLIKKIIGESEHLFLDGDDPTVRELLKNPSTEEIRAIVANHKLIFIDEAQRIENIGITLKIIADQFKQVQIIASGSSAFDLQNQMNEPLTGRKWEFQLFPITWQEMEQKNGLVSSMQQLENRLIYGFYPEVINHPGEEREVLNEITRSYMYQDILAYAGIRKPEILEKILRALAFQIGNEVSYNEIAQLVGVDKNTVKNYINLLEKVYVIFPLFSFSRNLRNEIKTNRKIYFYDVGIRNAIIQNFNPLSLRNDKGALWENFLVSERIKQHNYHKTYTRCCFWRTVRQQEIDFVEDVNENIKAFEFKWNDKKNFKTPALFKETYGSEAEIIHHQNFRNFVLK